MGSTSPFCAYGQHAISNCVSCGALLCEEHAVIGVNATDQKEKKALTRLYPEMN